MLLMKASLLAFVLLLFYRIREWNTSVCICAWYFQRFLPLDIKNKEAPCDFVYFYQFSSYLSTHLLFCTYLMLLIWNTWTTGPNIVMSQMMRKLDYLCSGPQYWRKGCARTVQMLNKQRRIQTQKEKRLFWMGGHAVFLFFIHLIFLREQ